MVGGAAILQKVHPRNGVCDLPYMFQCTWCISSSDSSQTTRFSLGSSLAGYDWRSELTGTWETVLRRARSELVDVDITGVGSSVASALYDPRSDPAHPGLTRLARAQGGEAHPPGRDGQWGPSLSACFSFFL